MEILTRTFIALLLITLGIALYWLTNRVILARVRGRRLGLESLRPGVPAILYFTSPTCVPCKTVQRPELRKLKKQLGENIQIIQADCTERPDLAEYWGVLSVPTTFIIDAKGRPRGVNHGVTRADKLHKQILDTGEARAEIRESSDHSLYSTLK
jgi:thioredoxin-like negative regulator of GroEL